MILILSYNLYIMQNLLWKLTQVRLGSHNVIQGVRRGTAKKAYRRYPNVDLDGAAGSHRKYRADVVLFGLRLLYFCSSRAFCAGIPRFSVRLFLWRPDGHPENTL